jgi:hypothetical protein
MLSPFNWMLDAGPIRGAASTCGIGTVLDIDTGVCQCDTDLACRDSRIEGRRELQASSGDEDVVHLAGVFDMSNFNWGSEIFDFTVSLINNHSDGWHDDIFNETTKLEYRLADSACDETLAARAYWDLRTYWGGPMHGVVGCRCSGASMAIARIAALEAVSQISPTSTSVKLSDKFLYPFFHAWSPLVTKRRNWGNDCYFKVLRVGPCFNHCYRFIICYRLHHYFSNALDYVALR